MKIIRGFYQQQPAYRLALESGKLRGEIELDGVYFGGRRKGKRGRGAAGKSIVFGLLERNGRVYTKGVDSVSANELMEHIIKHIKKGSVYFTDTFRSYRSLKRFGIHHTISHGKNFPKTKNNNE